MAVEDVRLRLRRKLEEMVGVDEADLLMDRPPGGWSELVTKDWLREEFDRRDAVLEHRFVALDYRFDAVDERFGSIDRRFESMERHFDAIDQRFESMERRFESMGRGFDRRFESMDQRFQSMDGKLGDLKSEINKQTWRLMTAMLVGMSILTAIFGLLIRH